MSGSAAQDATYDVTINGQVQKVPLQELLKGYSRQSDYTRKTQELAERERAYQFQTQQYEAALGELKSFLEDRDRVQTYLQSLMQEHEAQNIANDPNQLLTAEQAQALMDQRLQQLAAYQQQQLMGVQHQMQVSQLTEQYTPKVDQKVAELKSRFPALNSPRTERMLRMETLNRRPQSLQEAMQVMEDVANEIHGDISNIFKTTGSQGLPSQLSNGIEPRGGQGQMPTPNAPFKGIKDPALRAAVLDDLIKGSAGSR